MSLDRSLKENIKVSVDCLKQITDNLDNFITSLDTYTRQELLEAEIKLYYLARQLDLFTSNKPEIARQLFKAENIQDDKDRFCKKIGIEKHAKKMKQSKQRGKKYDRRNRRQNTRK